MAAAIIAVDKPYGWTSTAVVRWVKRRWKVRKAGHAGTLDPLATGLVLVAIEEATAEIAQLQAEQKEYYALLMMGYRSLSDDAEYPPEQVADPGILSPEMRRSVLRTFEGEILQRPPAFSALKLQGKRAYSLARKGVPVDIPPRYVCIHRIEEVFYHPPYRWMLRVECGKGVYIRSLARDIGEKVGWGAYLGALRRTRIGPYHVRNSVQPDAVSVG
ncbi:MAG: tRNA pseudouridine(55) synthase TruB [Bacteroidia bacterium]|nr:tRNA pseudouridine(55) synthase TruB [Bacteroidia bacterium]